VAQTVQSHPPTPGPQHAPSCSRNSNQEWHRTWGLDNLADRAIILEMGQVVFDGKAQEVLDDADMRQQYLAI